MTMADSGPSVDRPNSKRAALADSDTGGNRDGLDYGYRTYSAGGEASSLDLDLDLDLDLEPDPDVDLDELLADEADDAYAADAADDRSTGAGTGTRRGPADAGADPLFNPGIDPFAPEDGGWKTRERKPWPPAKKDEVETSIAIGGK